MRKKSMVQGTFVGAMVAVLGFGATQAFAGVSPTYPGTNYCHSTNCNESCRLFGDFSGGYCARDESGYLVCYCY